MPRGIRYLVMAVVVSVVMFGAAAGGYVYAQGVVMITPVAPRVLSGADIGFRMEGWKGKMPTGTLVVRVNGDWVEVDYAGGLKLLTK